MNKSSSGLQRRRQNLSATIPRARGQPPQEFSRDPKRQASAAAMRSWKSSEVSQGRLPRVQNLGQGERHQARSRSADCRAKIVAKRSSAAHTPRDRAPGGRLQRRAWCPLYSMSTPYNANFTYAWKQRRRRFETARRRSEPKLAPLHHSKGKYAFQLTAKDGTDSSTDVLQLRRVERYKIAR